MDFVAEEELCQQAYEVWRHYACPACEGSSPPTTASAQLQAAGACDGPCSVLPILFFSGSSHIHTIRQ